MKADVAEQLKAEKSVTERTSEDAVVEESQIKTRRSRKIVEDAVTEKATVIKATEEKSVSSVAETVLKHETVHEVADDSTCSTRSRIVPDRRLLTS